MVEWLVVAGVVGVFGTGCMLVGFRWGERSAIGVSHVECDARASLLTRQRDDAEAQRDVLEREAGFAAVTAAALRRQVEQLGGEPVLTGDDTPPPRPRRRAG